MQVIDHLFNKLCNFLYDTFLAEVILCKKFYRKRQTTFIILLVSWDLEETHVLTLVDFAMSKHIMVMDIIKFFTSNCILMLQYYDIRKKCEGSLCYDFSNMEKFLNQRSVRDALGVGDIDFVSCSSTVYQAMLVDWMRNLEVGIPTLLEDGISLLVYAGEYDLICNWLGMCLTRFCRSILKFSISHLRCIDELFPGGVNSMNR